MRPKGWILLTLGLGAFQSPALECSVVIPDGYEGSVKQVSDVRDTIAASSAVIDGEVVRPGDDSNHPALVYAHRVLKGPNQRWFTIAIRDTCSIPLSRIGERMRMILFEGPEKYDLSIDQSSARIEDRILGSDRRRDFPYFAGPRRERQ